MTIGQRIKEARLKCRMNQTELAREHGNLSQISISQLEANVNKATTYIGSLAHILGVNALWLETGLGKPDLDYVHPPEAKYCKEIQEVIKLMQLTDDRGRRKVVLAVEDVLEAHKAYKNSLPRAQEAEIDKVGEHTRRLREKLMSEIDKSEGNKKTLSDVYLTDEQNIADHRDKHH
jgi:transcriptional regulator with XRE-family HTH domain